MAKDFSYTFYNSVAWKKTRSAYTKSVGGLCELCREQGLYNAGEIVHHKKHLTPNNIDDPNITLAWSNLLLVCRECHEKIHRQPTGRYMFSEDGELMEIKK